MTTLPTRKDEDWRWSNLAALGAAWPQAHVEARTLTIAAGETGTFEDHIAGDAWRNDDMAISVGANGHLAATIRQGVTGLATQLYRLTLNAGASAHIVILNHGGRLGRIALDITLHDGADLMLGAVLIGQGEQTLELVTTVRHIGTNATSRQVVRAVACGQATTSYLGKVAVARTGQKTDASQSFKALLLNRGATANAKPELEIFADDVKCAHGAAIGELDGTALFYLTSRGIPPAQARALLTRAFLSDALDGLGDSVRDTLEAEITALMDTAP